MDKLQKLLEKHKDDPDWIDSVRIIAISIDKEDALVYKHVMKRGWYKIESYHKGNSMIGIRYSINAVPFCMMIDKEGKIAYKGHPEQRDNIEDDLNKLLKGE
jgi:hypothetical protein